MLEPRDVALHPGLDLFCAPLPIKANFVGETFEINFVSVAAAVQAEEQNHRTMHHGCKHDRTNGEDARRVKELTTGCFIGAEDAIAQYPDKAARVDAFSDPDQCIRPIRCDTCASNHGI